MDLYEMEYAVAIQCMTYNHAKYISNALDGFSKQQTDFPFIAIIVDDASTDNEQQVIQDYLLQEFDMSSSKCEETNDYIRVTARHKTNNNCFFLVLLLKYNHYKKKPRLPYFKKWQEKARYIALCEGDDYWTDPLKLQKQVIFMDQHTHYAMCCTDAKILMQEENNYWTRYNIDQEVPIEDIIIGGGLWLQTVTFLYRNGLTSDDKYPDFCRKCHVGDYPLIIWAALNGGVYYLHDDTSTYRFNTPGSWTNKSLSKNPKELVSGWHSEIDMLKGLDRLSNYTYTKAFQKRINYYLYEVIILNHKKDLKLIQQSFSEDIKRFNKMQKIHLLCIKIHQEKLFQTIRKYKSMLKQVL